MVVGLAAAAAGIVYLTGKEQSSSDLNDTLTSASPTSAQALDQQHTATGTRAAAARRSPRRRCAGHEGARGARVRAETRTPVGQPPTSRTMEPRPRQADRVAR